MHQYRVYLFMSHIIIMYPSFLGNFTVDHVSSHYFSSEYFKLLHNIFTQEKNRNPSFATPVKCLKNSKYSNPRLQYHFINLSTAFKLISVFMNNVCRLMNSGGWTVNNLLSKCTSSLMRIKGDSFKHAMLYMFICILRQLYHKQKLSLTDSHPVDLQRWYSFGRVTF